jgi:hypothetical protein
MFRLAGIANRRLPGKPRKFAVFSQMQFLSRFMFMLAGLANLRQAGKPKLMCRVSSNAILVSFYVHAGRACQPSPARKPEKCCSFRQMQFLSRLMSMLAGLANPRQPGHLQINCSFFVKCNPCLVSCSCWLGLPTYGSPESQKNVPFFVRCTSRLLFMFMLGLLNIGCLNSGKTVFSVSSFFRSSQLSAAESSTSDCSFVIDLFMSSTMRF